MARKPDSDVFIDRVRQAGGRLGNGALQATLGWSDEKYWRIHQEQIESGRIEKGRGRGGTVILVDITNPTAPADVAAKTAEVVLELPHRSVIVSSETEHVKIASGNDAGREIDLYKPVLEQLQKNWKQRRQLDDCHCEITAMQGRRDTGGSWSRPDVTVVGYKKYEYIPEKILEVFSFEIKPAYDVSIKGVLEALAHRESATRSYVIYHTAGRSISEFPENIRIEELAIRHGIGVYAASDIRDFSTWEEITTAPRASPDPDTLETFIKRTLSEDARSRLRKWF